jgi:hypothetical protein
MSPLHQRLWRTALTPASLLSTEEVIEALPLPEQIARSWLRENVPPTATIEGTDVWFWGDVVERLHGEGQHQKGAVPSNETESGSRWLSTSDAAGLLGIPRSTLDAMLRRAPSGLPGAPILAGSGNERRHWRWDSAVVEDWLRAFREWEADKASKRPRPSRKRTRLAKRKEPQGSKPVDWASTVAKYGRETTEDESSRHK